MSLHRILTVLTVCFLLSCRDGQVPSEGPGSPEKPDSEISKPNHSVHDSIRLSPAQRKIRKKHKEGRPKGLDTLKPVAV